MEKIRNLRGKKLTSNWREGYDNLIRLKSSFFVADKTSYLPSRLHIVLCLNRFKSLIKHLNYVITTESFVNEGSKFFVKKCEVPSTLTVYFVHMSFFSITYSQAFLCCLNTKYKDSVECHVYACWNEYHTTYVIFHPVLFNWHCGKGFYLHIKFVKKESVKYG